MSEHLSLVIQPMSWGSSNRSGDKVAFAVSEGFEELKNKLFDVTGKPDGRRYACVIVELEDDGTLSTEKKEKEVAQWGDAAKLLRFDLSGALPAIQDPNFLRLFGSDADYQKFCRSLGESATGQAGEGQIVYAHVRRASNSGIGIKPEYWGIPLWWFEHDKQHQDGEVSTFGDKDFMVKQRHKYISKWIGSKFGVESLRFVDPFLLCKFADSQGGIGYVPMAYRRAAKWV